VTIHTGVAEGELVGALIEVCRAGDYDLLVLGNRGMTGVSRFLRLGSVPNKVSHHLPCSVLIVKTT
jgi:nucleotide-binding universal stress UspA family protein